MYTRCCERSSRVRERNGGADQERERETRLINEGTSVFFFFCKDFQNFNGKEWTAISIRFSMRGRKRDRKLASSLYQGSNIA